MKNYIPLIFSSIVLIALIGVYGFMYTSIAAGVERTEIALSQTDSLGARDALVRSQQIFLEDSLQERTQLEVFVANESQVIEIIEIVEDTADDERVDVAISTVNTVAQDGWQMHEGVVVNFSASGTFSRMMRFIAALESLPIGSRLESASLEVSSDGEWFGTFSVMFVKIK